MIAMTDQGILRVMGKDKLGGHRWREGGQCLDTEVRDNGGVTFCQGEVTVRSERPIKLSSDLLIVQLTGTYIM